MQIKKTMKYHYIPFIIVQKKKKGKTDSNGCQRGYGTIGQYGTMLTVLVRM